MTRTVELTARVRDGAGNTATSRVAVTIESAVLGWCPPESTTTEVRSMLARYPTPRVMRLFSQPGKGIAPWGSGMLAELPAGTALHYSFKDWSASTSPSAIRDWLSARPTARKGVVDYLTLDHEPEQQTGGDPTPAEFQQEWRELVAALADHPRRSEVRLVPVFTEYYARRQSSWWDQFGHVADYPGVDAVGMDIYDTGYSTYRTPMERNDYSLATARRVGKPLVIPEWGIQRKGYDADGTLAARAMRDNMAHLRAQPDVSAVCWFYRGFCHLHNTLSDPAIGTYVRDVERATLVDLMT